MKIPLIIWVAGYSYALPLAVLLRRPSELRGPRRGLAVWLALILVGNVVSWVWTYLLDGGNNHFLGYYLFPLQGVALLWAIADWQVVPVLRTTVRFCIPLLVVWWTVNIVFLEDLANFSRYGQPVHGMLMLATALLTLVTRAVAEEEPIVKQDWFWILSGIAVLFVTVSTVSILQNIAINAGDYELAATAQVLKARVTVISMLAITWGFLWPSRPVFSGASSLPAPSR